MTRLEVDALNAVVQIAVSIRSVADSLRILAADKKSAKDKLEDERLASLIAQAKRVMDDIRDVEK